jgi:hypothetical protein
MSPDALKLAINTCPDWILVISIVANLLSAETPVGDTKMRDNKSGKMNGFIVSSCSCR